MVQPCFRRKAFASSNFQPMLERVDVPAQLIRRRLFIARFGKGGNCLLIRFFGYECSNKSPMFREATADKRGQNKRQQRRA
jgi:hypothetical protein